MKRMLINATQQEELRMAMVDGQKLFDLDIEVPGREQKKANIYKGKITRVEPSLEAAFVEYGAERHGFLPLKEISREYFVKEPEPGSRINIKDVIREGQEIVVQIEKIERGTKGAALTSFISLAGRFIVLMPNNPRAGGVSRRITGEDRDLVRDSLRELNVDPGMGLIIRTAGVGRGDEELKWDLDYLMRVWEAIKMAAVESPSPFLIYQESNAVIRALRDHLSDEIGEILIDDVDTFAEAMEFVERVMPNNVDKLKHYDDKSVPLFTRFQIESQIQSAFSHKVILPSGGSVVIDHTEALISIDINSARATKGGDIEATAFNTNLEAADEIARQFRLRDIGGLIVIDFIDMSQNRHQREVEQRLREAVKQDRARVQIGRISRFGLLEMSRQRLRPSLGESTQIVCPRCSGSGNIRDVDSLSLAILRLLGEETRKEHTTKVIAQVPVSVGTYLLNEKREWVAKLEERAGITIVIVPNADMETPNFEIRRVRDDEAGQPENSGLSYEMATTADDDATVDLITGVKTLAEQPAVASIVPDTKLPTRGAAKKPARSKKKGPGLLASLFGLLGLGEKSKPRKQTSGQRRTSGRRKPSGGRSGSSRGQGKQSSGRRDNRAATSGKTGAKDNRKKVAGEADRADDKGRPRKPSRRRGRRGRGSQSQDNQAKATQAQATAPAEKEQDTKERTESRSRRPQRGPGRTSRGDRSRTQTDRRKIENKEAASAPKEEAPQAVEQTQDFTSTQPLEKHESPKPMPVATRDKVVETKDDAKPTAEKKPAAIEGKEKTTKEKPAAAKKSRPRKPAASKKRPAASKTDPKAKDKQESVAKKDPASKEKKEAAESSPPASATQKESAKAKPEAAVKAEPKVEPKPATTEKKDKRTVYSSGPTQERSGPGRRDDW